MYQNSDTFVNANSTTDGVGCLPVTFTTYQSTSGDLSKTYEFGTDGNITKEAAAKMTEGVAMLDQMVRIDDILRPIVQKLERREGRR